MNERMARQHWGPLGVIGGRISTFPNKKWRDVIGVLKDACCVLVLDSRAEYCVPFCEAARIARCWHARAC